MATPCRGIEVLRYTVFWRKSFVNDGGLLDPKPSDFFRSISFSPTFYFSCSLLDPIPTDFFVQFFALPLFILVVVSLCIGHGHRSSASALR